MKLTFKSDDYLDVAESNEDVANIIIQALLTAYHLGLNNQYMCPEITYGDYNDGQIFTDEFAIDLNDEYPKE